MRIGLVGGSFNPIHRGHLAIARSAREALHLDRVILIPSARPPHKKNLDLAPAADRLAMARLAAGPGIEVSSIELDRQGPSYTVDTLRAFHAQEPDAELTFIIGADSVPELVTWRDAKTLVGLARFAVAARPGHDLDREVTASEQALGAKFTLVPIEPDPVSATDIRERVRAGRSIDGLVPDAVRDYIRAHHLYSAKATTS
ncbi:MAG TPA: nicotinate-nucleotide adenylyltransferase [Planctomycetota bacterium]|nr:nicotinate-nucleotide adenylyltransferase [Planctomycetota bacterium]